MKVRVFTSLCALAFSVLILTACARPSAKSQSSPVSTPPQGNARLSEFSIKGTIGVVGLSGRTSASLNRFRFFNADRSIWFEFPVTSEYVENEAFRPFAQKLDYSVLVLKCVSEDDTQFEVIVNETSGLRKFIRKSDQLFQFQRWEDHILDLFAVDFDQTKNPLRRTPSENAPLVQPVEQVFYQPVEIRKNWLKVRLEDTGGSKPKARGTGWIKWREGDELLIEFFYFA